MLLILTWQSVECFWYLLDKVLNAFDMGAVDTFIVWEFIDINIYDLKNCAAWEIVFKHLNRDQEADQSSFRDSSTSAKLEVQDDCPMSEWLVCYYKEFCRSLKFVKKQSLEGYHFWRDFGGIGGILSPPADIRSFNELSEEKV